MGETSRRRLLASLTAGAALNSIPASIRKALAVPAQQHTGTMADVGHVVILMQENRSFDHYFGTMAGVRGFGDRFTIPLPGGRQVWEQQGKDRIILPYHLDARLGNAQCVIGTPHEWPDAQQAWDHGRMSRWPMAKTATSMGYLRESEIPFQFALANAFTLCDAYHCSLHAGTNPNRLFLWTGSHGAGAMGVAALLNEWDVTGPAHEGYTWKTYPERLQAAGIDWKVYQYLPDNFGNNPLAGFRSYRKASIRVGNPSHPPEGFSDYVPWTPEIEAREPLYKGNGNTLPAPGGSALEVMLDGLRRDVQQGRLPQVSWIVAPRMYCEHPQGSSPVQGAWFTQQVLDILTENPEVWSKTVLFVNYDENDGYFDHMPTPAAPSRRADGSFAGQSTVRFDDELFQHPAPKGSRLQPTPDGGVYGLGPRVPMLVISPWSRGGWVNSQVFDHTSVIQFLERRFGVQEPNITAWRRAICGDLSSAFDFRHHSQDRHLQWAGISRAWADQLRQHQESLPQVPLPAESSQTAGVQARGVRRSRALPYALDVQALTDPSSRAIRLQLHNLGKQGAVLHVYDQRHLQDIPRRYTIEAGKSLQDTWHDQEAYDLWLLGPNGFHRAYRGHLQQPQVEVAARDINGAIVLTLINRTPIAATVSIDKCPYTQSGPWTVDLASGSTHEQRFDTQKQGGWYDITLHAAQGWMRRLAGRIETGRDSISDPLLGNGSSSHG